MPDAATSSTSPTRSCTAGRGWTRPARPVRRHRRRRPLLRPVRAVPGDRADAARRARRGRRPPTSGSPGSTPLLAAAGVGLCWWLLGRIGVRRLARPRSGSSLLFGFSTQILWVTTRGGVWHTGHLIATILTFACLIELWGSRRAWLDRAPGRCRVPDPGAARVRDPVLRAAARRPWRTAGVRARGHPVAVVGVAGRRRRCRRSSFFFAYNASGSGRRSSPATRSRRCPPWLERQRDAGPASRSPTSR